ncbi:hypothetical protein BDD12DRAFT_913955 [Trichophaea hybrida]|nr:hypothetical protein BDD12DRAFT_913955 [Trichophaea hybrida]
MPPGERGNKGKRRNRPQHEQDPRGNEQEHLQTGGASSVKPALERDGISPPVPTLSTEDYNIGLGASQNITGGRSLGHTPTSRNTAAGYNTGSTRNTTMTNSNDTVGNSRAYKRAKHNEFTHSEFYGDQSFGDTHIHNTPQPSLPMDARMYGVLQKLVQTISWDILSGQLSVINQDEYRSTISPFNREGPENFWISKNIDFTQWESDNDSRALLLSAPPGHRTTEVCSYVVDLAKEKASQTSSSVLHFFSLSVTKARHSTVFTHTLLHQVVCCSNAEIKADSIATTFLSTLLGGHFRRHTQVFKEDDPPYTTIQKILDAPENELIEALVEAIKTVGIHELSIIVDGLSEDIARLVVKQGMRATRKLKALFTIDQSPIYGETLDRMTCIEYDKERKECLRSLHYDDTRYDKISEEHHGSLEWLWKHPQYLQWSVSATSSLLYIEGKPGSGKSTLAKYFVKNLVDKVPNARSSTVAHYFYTFRGTILESTHENMLRSILHSILEQDESAFFNFQQEFRDFRRRNHSEWPYKSLQKVLSTFANHPPTKTIYLILDAMDESNDDERRKIIQLLCKLCLKENPCSIKVFLASRPVPELKHHIQEHPLVITLQDENKRDISGFAIGFLEKEVKLTGKILGEAAEYIIGNADGAGEWSPADIQIGKQLFRFVLFARRPFTVVELRDALALAILDDHNASYEEFQQNLISAISRRIEHCGGDFLEIKADKTVQFMHQTAREFLIRTIPNANSLIFDLSDDAHRALTTMWVRYLMLCFTTPRMQDGFSTIWSWSPEDFRAYAEYLNEWPLIEYTFRYLKDHHDLGGPNEDVSQLVTALIRKLADNQASYFFGSFLNFRFGNNYGIVFPLNEYQEASENMKHCTLNAAADPKLPHVVEALLLTCTQDAPHAQRKTPLIISVQKGLVGATQLLLDLDDDKDTKDDSGRTALHYAAENGDEAIVQLLVEKGADKRIRDNSEETALHIAVKKLG